MGLSFAMAAPTNVAFGASAERDTARGASNATTSTASPWCFYGVQRVTIEGYTGDAMEPFLTRDGRFLLFNNSNDPAVDTNLYFAERIDDWRYAFRGEIQGVNSPALDGVASLDRFGRLYFVSTRSYDQTASTVYRGRFENGRVIDVELVPGISIQQPGIVNFDVEVSADGETLYFVESQFLGTTPQTAKLVIARHQGQGFARIKNSDDLLRAIDTPALEYAAAISEDQRHLFFTRLDAEGARIYQTQRASTKAPFDAPRLVDAITGFVEAPTLSADESLLFFHRRDADGFQIYGARRAKVLPARD